PAALGSFFDEVSTTLGAYDADLDQYLFRVSALGVITTTDKTAETPLSIDKGVSTQWAVPLHKFRFFPEVEFGQGLIGDGQIAGELLVKFTDDGNPRFSFRNLVQFILKTRREVN